MRNLMTFPWIAEEVTAGRLILQSFIFDIHTGVLTQITDTGIEAIS